MTRKFLTQIELPADPAFPMEAATRQYVDGAASGGVVPWYPGDLKATVATSAPTGWLMLDGSAIPNANTTYVGLWAVAPTAWKSGTTLNLPNMAGRTFFGGGGLGPGGMAGSNTVSLTISNLPAHNHPMPHTHDISSRVAVGTAGGAVQGAAAQSGSNAVTSNLSNANTSNTGSGTDVDIVPAHLRVNYMVKT